MSDTPTAAPALTDEQIDVRAGQYRQQIVADGLIGDDREGRAWDAWYAAVVARAKREAAEEIAREIDRLHDTVYQARRVPELDPLRVDTACQAYRDGAAIARRIGAEGGHGYQVHSLANAALDALDAGGEQ